MKKKLLSLSVAVVLTLCSVLSPSVTAFANSDHNPVKITFELIE